MSSLLASCSNSILCLNSTVAISRMHDVLVFRTVVGCQGTRCSVLNHRVRACLYVLMRWSTLFLAADCV